MIENDFRGVRKFKIDRLMWNEKKKLLKSYFF